MSSNVCFTPTTTVLDLSELSKFTSTGMQRIDMIRVWFEYFFTTEHTLKEQNKFLLLSLQDALNNGNIEIVNRFLSDAAMKDLHPSLIKSALIISDGVLALDLARGHASKILMAKI